MRLLDAARPIPDYVSASSFAQVAVETVHQARVVEALRARSADPARGPIERDDLSTRLRIGVRLLGAQVERNHEALAATDQGVDIAQSLVERGVFAALEHVRDLRRGGLVLARATAKAERAL